LTICERIDTVAVSQVPSRPVLLSATGGSIGRRRWDPVYLTQSLRVCNASIRSIMEEFMGLRLETASSDIDTISQRVERIVRLRTASRIHNLRVDVQGSDVILTGMAPTYYVKQLATHAALDEIEQRTLTNDIDVV
jgi:hypothetical protein